MPNRGGQVVRDCNEDTTAQIDRHQGMKGGQSAARESSCTRNDFWRGRRRAKNQLQRAGFLVIRHSGGAWIATQMQK